MTSGTSGSSLQRPGVAIPLDASTRPEVASIAIIAIDTGVIESSRRSMDAIDVDCMGDRRARSEPPTPLRILRLSRPEAGHRDRRRHRQEAVRHEVLAQLGGAQL